MVVQVNKEIQYLILGPGPYHDTPWKTGGIIVLNEIFLQWLNLNNYSFFFIDTNKSNYSSKAFAFFAIVVKFLYRMPKCDVIIMNGTANDYIYLAPLMVFVTVFFKKKIVLRKFAGNFDLLYRNLRMFEKYCVKYALKHADYLFWETKYLVEFGLIHNSNSFWFPNVRNLPKHMKGPDTFNYKFVFLSHVNEDKGVDVIIKSSLKFNNKISFDIYGPLVGIFNEKDFVDCKVRYCGVVEYSNVLKTLAHYSVLVLPSRREGYPGVILEAMSLGMPVIATRIGGIPELVEDGVSGILVDVGDTEQLSNAVNSISNDNYTKMSIAAYKKFKDFESDDVHKKIFKTLNFMPANELSN